MFLNKRHAALEIPVLVQQSYVVLLLCLFFLACSIPQEDYYESYENIFVVADGVTHDIDNGFYPNPSDSAEVAKIICNTFCPGAISNTVILISLFWISFFKWLSAWSAVT